MNLCRKKYTFNNCNPDEIKRLLKEGRAYPIASPVVIQENNAYYADFTYLSYLLEKTEDDNGVILEKYYCFWDCKDEIIQWLQGNYEGLMYKDV